MTEGLTKRVASFYTTEMKRATGLVKTHNFELNDAQMETLRMIVWNHLHCNHSILENEQVYSKNYVASVKNLCDILMSTKDDEVVFSPINNGCDYAPQPAVAQH